MFLPLISWASRLMVCLVMLFMPLISTAEADNSCPAVDCDCSAMALPRWQAQCLEAQAQTRMACAANGGVPTQYCTLQGPNAKPVAFAAPRPEVDNITAETLQRDKRQLLMLSWSINDDLSRVKEREQQGMFGDALQIEKLLEENVERLFKTQWQIAEGERKTQSAEAAVALWLKYHAEYQSIVAQLDDYGNQLWQKYEQAAKDSREQKAYLLLSMRILRLTSLGREHLALASVGQGDAKNAAQAWQQAALQSMNLMKKEMVATGKPERVDYYRYQAATRWHQASFYWMDVKNEERIADSLAAAERVLTMK